MVGSGLDVVYPRGQTALWRSVGRAGVLLSEAPPGARRAAPAFPLPARPNPPSRWSPPSRGAPAPHPPGPAPEPPPAVVRPAAVAAGVVALLLVAFGWLLGDRTWWLFIANLTTSYWLAPSLVAAVVAVVRRGWVGGPVCVICAAGWLGRVAPLFLPPRAGGAARSPPG